MSATPAGWYPDPSGEHQYRFWDGNKWTRATADPQDPREVSPSGQAAAAQPAQREAIRVAPARPRRRQAGNEQAIEASGQELAAPAVSRTPAAEAPREIKRHTRRQAEHRSSEEASSATTSRLSAGRGTTRQQRVRGLLRGGLQDAIVINEILGPPVGLRERRENV